MLYKFTVKYFLVGIEPWTFIQKLGEAVFIPAGCPHQVRNLKVNLFNLRCRNQGLVSLFCCNLYLYFLIVDTLTTLRFEFVVFKFY